MLKDRTILIAGAGPGLGDETAKIVLREGGRVVLGARNSDRLAISAREIDPTGERVAYGACDIERDGDPEALVALSVERFGRLDGIVCVAACIDVNGTIETTPLAEWRRVLETNVIGTVRVIQAAIPALQASRGSIVIVGSQSEVNPSPSPSFIAYGASKLAMHSATIYMAQQLGPSGVRVNRVVPSTMWTPTLEGFAKQMAEEQNVSIAEIRAQFESGMPLGEMPSGSDVGEAIAFFLSERARRITGQELLVNSGEWMK
jgi:NAD(P)-dependent dehydrogenase (short-subunit alcohol dehydrogenase family)